MKLSIEVKDRDEADQIKCGLEDPDIRAMVRVVGVLKPMTQMQRRKVLEFVYESVCPIRQEPRQ